MRFRLRACLPRRLPRLARVAIWLATVAGVATAPAIAAANAHRHAPRSSRPRAHAAGDPGSNHALSQATLWTCEVNPRGAPCATAVVSAIDQVRVGERVRPMRLPIGFDGLTVSAQLLVLANLERSDRGLIPATGLSRTLNRNALAAARADQDPVPRPFHGTAYGSNWAGGIGSTLAVDFLWMYDDGPGSWNIDCRSGEAAGCWGHRHNILYSYQAPLVMGAAVAGTSMTEVFVGGDVRIRAGQTDAVLGVGARHR